MTRDDYKVMVMQVFEEECKKGRHSFQKIFESGSNMESSVVRWCEVCGSVVVDIDFDGRTNPGEVMRMLSPSITKALGYPC